MRLRDSEQVVQTHAASRKRLFGTQRGELCITNQRVAFVVGDRPIVELDRLRLRAEKVPHRRSFVLVLTSGGRSERVAMEPSAIDEVVALLAPDEDAPSLNHYKS
jgi:hypothetical protein